MSSDRLTRLASFVAGIGAEQADNHEIRLQKTLSTSVALTCVVAGLLWGLTYGALGARTAGLIPIAYSAITLASIGLFARLRQFELFRFLQLLLILLLPWGMTIALGGFAGSSAVILWSGLCPLGALLSFDDIKRASRWFFGFLGLLIAAAFVRSPLPDDHIAPLAQTLFYVMNIGGVLSISFVMLYYFVHQKNIYEDKSENLLLNVLPKEIADILRNDTSKIAHSFTDVSIVFADIVQFTPLSQSMTPIDLVTLLDEVFLDFDRLVDEYGVEKIKTIGDCYMAAAGVPRADQNHAIKLVQVALHMLDIVSKREFGGRKLVFRVGINSGPVVAGIIGRKKFIYDLWGDAVNTASRMEMHGTAGAIQITRATYELIKDEFDCEPRGLIPIKGKADMEIWHVLGRKPGIRDIAHRHAERLALPHKHGESFAAKSAERNARAQA